MNAPPAALILLALLAAGCSPTAAPPEASSREPPGPVRSEHARPEPDLSPPAEKSEPRPRGVHPADAWVGRWQGPEGLFLQITPGETTNTARIRLRETLDGEHDYTGRLTSDRIIFERHGITETIRRGSGLETGFIDLKDRSDCVIVREGSEGYCRP